jgi:large subunit ribosomal protein L9
MKPNFLYKGQQHTYIKTRRSKLGFKDDVVTVKTDIGRNFFNSSSCSISYSSAKKVLAETLKQRAHKEAKVVSDAQAIAEALKAIEIKIIAKQVEKNYLVQ